jgi:hypothetical protein
VGAEQGTAEERALSLPISSQTQDTDGFANGANRQYRILGTSDKLGMSFHSVPRRQPRQQIFAAVVIKLVSRGD